jgi:FkbM family methyltransferase
MSDFEAGRYDRILTEVKLRLINTENKVNTLLGALQNEFRGHADQRYGHLTYSQHGEDLVFVALMERLGIEQPTYVDIGANHPVNCNNTWLLHQRGARGINIDASPDVIAIFDKMRPDDKNINIGVGAHSGDMTFYRLDATSGRNSFSRETMDRYLAEYPHERISDEISVAVLTLDDIIERYCNNQYPDFLSIDAEGLDYEILEQARFSTKPKVLCVETLSAAGDIGSQFDSLLTKKGFRKCINMFANAIYIDDSLKI